MKNFKRAAIIASGAFLAGALVISTPVAANASQTLVDAAPVAEISDREAPLTESGLTGEELYNYESFDAVGDHDAPEVTDVGSELGPGISELLDEQTVAAINNSRVDEGQEVLPAESFAIRYMDSGAIDVLNEQGDVLVKLSSEGDIPDPDVELDDLQARGIIPEEAKRIVEACLGVGIFGGISAETITQWFGTPAKAAKFVIRRLGVFGAVSCAGGVIWRYV